VYDPSIRAAMLARLAAGESLRSVSLASRISRSTLREWQVRGGTASARPACPCLRCNAAPVDRGAYLYLLGQYLGDGCISRMRRTWVLRIATCNAYPDIRDEVVAAINALVDNPVHFVTRDGCTSVQTITKQWLHLFPQHGPGRKHERPILLEPWQVEMVDADPRPLIRGLIHSDGCRTTNWTTRTVGGTTKRYEYPRYFFSNRSDDIRAIFTGALDRLGIAWRQNQPWSISVARRDAVAALDRFVGPKR
jgi:hypothetical protein